MAANDRRTIAWSLVVAGVCLGSFLALALLLPTDGPIAFDVRMTTIIGDLPVPVAAWEILTMLGGDLLVAVDVAVVVVLLARRELAMAVLFAVTIIAVTLGVDVIKDTVARARPPDPLVTARGGSFPSGHTFMSTVSYGLLALVAWRTAAPRAARIAVIAGTGIMVILIGSSRVALGVHFPTDVIAGWLGGMAVLAVVVTISVAWETRRSMPPDRAAAAVGHP